jgi:UDP-glucose:(heptosyl)LPS alpha-1,3-glucosyltransferase
LTIALVILHADPSRGGAERYTLDLARGLRGRGHRVSVLASSFAEGHRNGDDVRLEARGTTRVGRYVKFLNSLDRHLATAGYDVVHAMLPVLRCDVYHPHAGIAAEAVATGHLKYASRTARAIARTAIRFNRRRQKFARVERALLTGARPPIVLCLSEYVKGFVRKYYPLPPGRLAKLFNAVELERFDPRSRPGAGPDVRERFGLAADRVVALMMAQDFARKGLREAILALAAANDPRLTLLVVGKQEARAYRVLAERSGVGGRVIFAGPTQDPYAFYRAADFFVLPSRHDPCSLVVLEALAMGLPVISTAFNGACEVMSPGEHGFVLKDPTDIQALTAAMRSMLDRENRLSMSNACLHLRPALSFEHHLDELVRIYQGAAQQSGKAPLPPLRNPSEIRGPAGASPSR